MQRELSSFDIMVLVTELQQLSGSYIEKCYQLSKDEMLIRMKHKQTNQKQNLYIKNEELLCITIENLPTPAKPTTFAMTLRKYLSNGILTNVTQHEFDRIITLTIEKKDGSYQLIIELFKNGNIILINPKGSIILPLKIQQWAHRSIKPKQPYEPPPSQLNPFTIDQQQFNEILQKSNKDLVRTLATTLNLSGTYAEEILKRAQLDKHQKAQELKPQDKKILFSTINTFLNIFRNQAYEPILILKDETPIDIIPFPFETYASFTNIKKESFVQGLSNFISKTTKQPVENPWQEKLDKINRQYKQQQRSIETFKKNIAENKTIGDLLYQHYQTIQDILQEAQHILHQKNKNDHIQSFLEHSLISAFCPEQNQLSITLPQTDNKSISINLNPRKTIEENAEKFYQESKKAQKKLEGAQKAVQNTKNKIQAMQEKSKKHQEQQPNKVEPKKHFWFEHYRWSISSEGNIIIAGKDAKTNERIVKKYLESDDRYVHADIHGAASCIVKHVDIHDNPLPISEQTLEEACIFAACYSRAWKQFAEAQVYWVLPEQVSKTPQSGEFVPKGAFIIRGKRNYLRCPLKLAIGKITLDHTQKIMAGAPTSVQKQSTQYAIIEPQGEQQKKIIDELATTFNVNNNEIMQVLPPGEAHITEVKKNE